MNPGSMNKTTGERGGGERKPSLRFRNSTPPKLATAAAGSLLAGGGSSGWPQKELLAFDHKSFYWASVSTKKHYYVYQCGYVGSHPEHFSAVAQNKELTFTVWILLRRCHGINAVSWMLVKRGTQTMLNFHLFCVLCPSHAAGTLPLRSGIDFSLKNTLNPPPRKPIRIMFSVNSLTQILWITAAGCDTHTEVISPDAWQRLAEWHFNQPSQSFLTNEDVNVRPDTAGVIFPAFNRGDADRLSRGTRSTLCEEGLALPARWSVHFFPTCQLIFK